MECLCKKCSQIKPIQEFDKYISAGPLEPWNVRQCKSCAHTSYVVRYNNPTTKAAQLIASSNWKKNNPDRHAELAKEYRARNKEKITAHNRLNYAVRTGKVTRLPCEVCGAAKSHGHHKSYRPEDWYNVQWLCKDCHKLEHVTDPESIGPPP